MLKKQHEEYLSYNKNEEESIIERFPHKKMEQYFVVIFEDVRHERSLVLLISLTHPHIIRQSKFTDYENDTIKISALEELHRQRILKQQVALSLLESQSE